MSVETVQLKGFATLLELRERIKRAEEKKDGEGYQVMLSSAERDAVISAIGDIETEVMTAQIYAEKTETDVMDLYASQALSGLISQGVGPAELGPMAFRIAAGMLAARAPIIKRKVQDEIDKRLSESRQTNLDEAEKSE